MFCSAIFEAMEVKGYLRFHFGISALKFFSSVWKFSCLPQKSNLDLCMTNSSDLSFLSLLLHWNKTKEIIKQPFWGRAEKTNKSELWNRSLKSMYFFQRLMKDMNILYNESRGEFIYSSLLLFWEGSATFHSIILSKTLGQLLLKYLI